MSSSYSDYSNYKQSPSSNIKQGSDDLKIGDDLIESKEEMDLLEKVNRLSQDIILESDEDSNYHVSSSANDFYNVVPPRVGRQAKKSPKIVEGSGDEYKAPSLHKLSAKQNLVLRELFGTEETYQESLSSLFPIGESSIFQEALEAGDQLLNDDQMEILTEMEDAYRSCLEKSKALSYHLSTAGDPQLPLAPRVSHAISALQSTCDDKFIVSLAQVSNHLNDLRSILRILREKSPEWASFEQDFRLENGGKSIGDQLITPIQRGPRYNMLGKELTKSWSLAARHNDLLNDLKLTGHQVEISLHKLERLNSIGDIEAWATNETLTNAKSLRSPPPSFWSSHQEADEYQRRLDFVKADLQVLQGVMDPPQEILSLRDKIEAVIEQAESNLHLREELTEQITESMEHLTDLIARPTHCKLEATQLALTRARKAIKDLPMKTKNKRFLLDNNQALQVSLSAIEAKLGDYGQPLAVAGLASPLVSLAPRAWDASLRERGQVNKTDKFEQYGQVVSDLVDEILFDSTLTEEQENLVYEAHQLFLEVDKLQKMVKGQTGAKTPEPVKDLIINTLESCVNDLENMSPELDDLGILGRTLKGALEGSVLKFHNLAQDKWT